MRDLLKQLHEAMRQNVVRGGCTIELDAYGITGGFIIITGLCLWVVS